MTKLCRSSQSEISGIMNFIINNEEIFIEDIKLDESEMIESSNSHEIMYNMKWIAKNILGLCI